MKTRWKITWGSKSVIVDGRRMHAHQAWEKAAPELGHPSFAEVTCEDIGPEERTALEPQDLIPHEDEQERAPEPEPAECVATTATCAPLSMRPDLCYQLLGESLDWIGSTILEREGLLVELCRERDELLRENERLRQHHEAIGELLSINGCDCECGHHHEEHDEDCERCLACRVAAALAR